MKTDKKYRNTVFCVVFFTLIICCVFWGINWETNDDPILAFTMCRFGAETTPWVNPLYSRFLSLLYEKSRIINWWFVFSVMGILISLIFYVKLINLKIVNQKLSIILSFFIIIATYFYTLRQINFTRTACYIANAGCLMVFTYFLWSEKTKRFCIGICGCVVFLWGICIRFQSGLLIIPFALCVLLFYKNSNKMQKTKVFFSGLIAIICILIIVCLSAETCSDELKQWKKENELLGILLDYPYEINGETDWINMNERGYYREDIDFLAQWYVGDKESLDVDFLEYISNIVSKDISIDFLFNEVCRMMKYSSMIWFFIFVVMISLLADSSRKMMIFMWGGVIACALIFLALGRLPGRVFESILFVGACDMTICMSINGDKSFVDSKNI